MQLIPLHPVTPSLTSFKSKLILHFWYQLTSVVLEKRLLNGCSRVVVWDVTIAHWQLKINAVGQDQGSRLIQVQLV